MIPMLGGGRLETDRKIPGPHWPVRLTKSMNSRLSEKPYLKNEVEIGHGNQNTEASESQGVQDQPHLQSEFQDRNSDMVRSCLNINNKIK